MTGLAFVFIILPISVILFLLLIFTKKKGFGTALIAMWVGLILLQFLSFIIGPFYKKKTLSKSDFYGQYIIDRSYFSGKQADWQYNNFRFEVKKNDSIYFYVTNGKEILQTYKGSISTRTPYTSARLAIHMEQPTHHILTTHPTIYRDVWSFYLVFNSPKFHNMYFKKGNWEELEN